MSDHDSESQARAQLEHIECLMRAYNEAADNAPHGTAEFEGEELGEESLIDRIHENALSLEVRSGWHCPSVHGADAAAEEYRICLCTGGPAVQIVGTLGQYGEPDTARIEHQDWGTPWTDLPTTQDEESALVEYAGQFFFGE